MDLYSRVIVGWQVDDNMEEDLIIRALKKGLQWRKPTAELIVHSDRGGQYVGNRFSKLLKKHHCLQSMSRGDDAYDNAFAESFFSRFKTELLEGGCFLSLEDAVCISNYDILKSGLELCSYVLNRKMYVGTG
jgi:transposase InsO family protein